MFLRELPIGTKIRERKSGYIFLIAEHGHVGYTETTLIADNALEYMAYDAAEPENPNQLIAEYGNGDYAVSNLHVWLNSDAADWYKPQHVYDSPPTPENTTDGDENYYELPYYAPGAKYHGSRAYAGKPGFLASMASDFVKMIYEVDVPVLKMTVPGCTEHTSISARVFLPSLTELGRARQEGEGSLLALFADPRYTFVAPDPRVIGQSPDYQYHDASWWYWTRSPFIAEYAYGRRLSPGHRGGDENNAAIDLTSCRNSSGVRPMFNIYAGAPVSDEPDANGVYEFRPSNYWATVRGRPLKRWTWTQEVSFNIPEDMKFNINCPCHNTGCARNGFCKACVAFHRCMDHDRFCRHKQTD